MTFNMKKSDVPTKAKSNLYNYIITFILASLVDWDALQTLWNNVSGAVLTSAVPLTSGAQQSDWHTLECGANTVVPTINPGEAPMDGKAEITGIVEGVDETTLGWAYGMQGEEVVPIVTRCSDGKKFIFANPCTGGMTFQYQSIGGQDGGKSGIAFQLTGTDCPKPMLVYAPES